MHPCKGSLEPVWQQQSHRCHCQHRAAKSHTNCTADFSWQNVNAAERYGIQKRKWTILMFLLYQGSSRERHTGAKSNGLK